MTCSLAIRTSQPSLHHRFEKLLPRIKTHGSIAFRHIKCRVSREEAIAEMIALAWKWFVRLHHRGKDAGQFMYNFTRFAAFAVKSGRRLCGHEKPNDVLSSRAQRERRFEVVKLPDHATLNGNPMMEALTDNGRSDPGDAAAFRIDFPRWLATWSDRDRKIITDMALGERTFDLADKYGCSRGRVSQKRDEYHQDWDRFHGEAA